jgi:hypothetical protein
VLEWSKIKIVSEKVKKAFIYKDFLGTYQNELSIKIFEKCLKCFIKTIFLPQLSQKPLALDRAYNPYAPRSAYTPSTNSPESLKLYFYIYAKSEVQDKNF